MAHRREKRGRVGSLLEITPVVSFVMDEEMTAAARNYHQTVRPGQPTILTHRELYAIALGQPPDVATRRAVQAIALREVYVFLGQRLSAFMDELRTDAQRGILDAIAVRFNVPPEDIIG